MKKVIIPLYAAILTLSVSLLTIGGCGDTLTDPRDLIFPDSGVSYQQHVQPLWNLSCTFSGCHNVNDRAGNLSLASYFDVMRNPGMVIIGNPEASILWQVLVGRLPHRLVFQARITPNHQDGVATWIREGALNN